MKIKESVIKTLSTFFGVGYLPFMPGTFASLAGLLIYFLIKNNPTVFILVTILLTALGFLVSGAAEGLFKKKDPSYVVIDEVAGMLLSLLFIPYDIKWVIAAFLIFRILDTLKPYPAGQIQEVKGSTGIMLDDIIAAVYTNILLQVVVRIPSFRGS
ncbi:MAG: phosphatidylglycerophosphatase A [Candidatus Omnitrophica bacterium]|nr:phosphatidylglycerophosphatase A [Candidatus Omnitrophota bacterium]